MSFIEQLSDPPKVMKTQILGESNAFVIQLSELGYVVESVLKLAMHDTGDDFGLLIVWGQSGSDETIETIFSNDGIMTARRGCRGVVDELDEYYLR